jgi:outer membrane protein assembly factor BamB
LAVSGQTVFVGYRTGELYKWNSNTGIIDTYTRIFPYAVTALSFHSNGKLFAGNNNNQLLVYSVDDLTPLQKSIGNFSKSDV